MKELLLFQPLAGKKRRNVSSPELNGKKKKRGRGKEEEE